MCRTVILLTVLAALATASVCSAQDSAKTRRKTSATAGVHTTHRRATSHIRHHATPLHAATATHKSTRVTTHKPSANEAGYTAGLAIRRRLAERRAARVNTAARIPRSSADFRTDSANAHRDSPAPAIRASRLNGAGPSSAAVAAPAVDEDSAQLTENAHPSVSKAVPARTNLTAARDSAAAEQNPGDAADANDAATPQEAAVREEGDDPGDAAEASHVRRSATPHAETEEASLRMPRGGMPTPLYGTLASLERQNARLEEEGLERIEDESDLDARIANKLLVPLPTSSALTVNTNLAENRRYCRPWTARFLADLARAHSSLFHRPLQVNSAVRTVEYQKRLMGTNGNAAPAEGDIVSPHLTGATVDIAKDGLSRREIAWMRQRLLALQTAGKIDVEEEFQQACFHITVYKTYAPPEIPRPGSKTTGPTRRARRHATPAASIAAAVGM